MKSSPNAKQPAIDGRGDAPSLTEAVRLCSQNGEFLAVLEGIYQSVDAELSSLPARCMGGGVCCKFDLAGHRLYVSTGELTFLTADNPPPQARSQAARCPYQLGPRCGARQRRPLGCRVFFCDGEAAHATGKLYEDFHRQIKLAHQTYRLQYAYVELTSALAQLFG